jgi:GAF domain-containing protein
LQDKLDQLTRELDDARQREAATSEVLKVINSSPGKLKPVFQAMLEQATRICDAKFGIVFRYEDGLFHPVASLDLPPALADFMAKQGAFAPQRGQLFGRLCESKTVINVVDRATDPNPSPSFRYGGARSSIAVPMLKGNELIGAFFIYRTEVRPFTDKQIELVQNFAAQAVIAIENARLLNELRQRTGDLSEALEQQTATSEVLKVISSSPGELKTVFQSLLENATRICEAAFGAMLQREGDVFRRVALHNAPAAFAEFHSRAPLVDPRKVSDLKRVVETKQVVHVADTAAEHPDAPIAKYAGGRTLLIVPMLKDEELIGIVGIYRQEVRPFSDKQIEIVKNFASQAVIAIENTRLLNELRESLQQQTATADVLKVISSSPGDMKPVFETMLTNALRICEAKFGHILLYDGECFHAAHLHDVPPAYREYWQKHGPIRPSPNTGLGRIVRDKQMFHIPDLKADAAYAAREPSVRHMLCDDPIVTRRNSRNAGGRRRGGDRKNYGTLSSSAR